MFDWFNALEKLNSGYRFSLQEFKDMLYACKFVTYKSNACIKCMSNIFWILCWFDDNYGFFSNIDSISENQLAHYYESLS